MAQPQSQHENPLDYSYFNTLPGKRLLEALLRTEKNYLKAPEVLSDHSLLAAHVARFNLIDEIKAKAEIVK